jgi:hypothetical protein
VDADGETLEESIERLRQIEKSLGVAVQQAAVDEYSTELQQLQHDHITLSKRCATMESAERSIALGGHRSNGGSGLGAWLTWMGKVCRSFRR